jgi:undecaprenyl-diphosphatase
VVDWMRRWLGLQEPVVLIAFALLGGGLWSFAEIAEKVIKNETHWFDAAVLRGFRSAADAAAPAGPGWLEDFARDVTALGGLPVLALVAAASVGFLLLDGKRRQALFVTASILGGWALTLGLKAAFERPRPEAALHRSVVYTASFPSGHAVMSTVTYLTLGALLAGVTPRIRMKAYLMAWASLTAMLVGVSRVYLGVHWPTDVLAGWAVGGSWALLCWLVAYKLQQDQRLEGGPGPAESG